MSPALLADKPARRKCRFLAFSRETRVPDNEGAPAPRAAQPDSPVQATATSTRASAEGTLPVWQQITAFRSATSQAASPAVIFSEQRGLPELWPSACFPSKTMKIRQTLQTLIQRKRMQIWPREIKQLLEHKWHRSGCEMVTVKTSVSQRQNLKGRVFTFPLEGIKYWY